MGYHKYKNGFGGYYRGRNSFGKYYTRHGCLTLIMSTILIFIILTITMVLFLL